jgi:hypothetical protein
MPTYDDGAVGAVLGNQSRGVSTRGENYDGAGVLLLGCGYSSETDSLGSFSWKRSGVPELVIKRRIANRRLGQETALRHHQH